MVAQGLSEVLGAEDEIDVVGRAGTVRDTVVGAAIEAGCSGFVTAGGDRRVTPRRVRSPHVAPFARGEPDLTDSHTDAGDPAPTLVEPPQPSCGQGQRRSQGALTP